MSRMHLDIAAALSLVLGAASVSAFGFHAQDEGHERVEQHLEKVERASEEMKEVRKRLDKAFEVYAKTLRDGADKRRSSYKDLVEALERCEGKTKELRKRHEEMDKTAEAFFKKWKDGVKDIRNGELKRRSERRLEETRERYREVSSRFQRMSEDYVPVLAAMRDHVVYLGHDLNDDSVASLREDASALANMKDELLRTMDGFRATAVAYIEDLESR